MTASKRVPSLTPIVSVASARYRLLATTALVLVAPLAFSTLPALAQSAAPDLVIENEVREQAVGGSNTGVVSVTEGSAHIINSTIINNTTSYGNAVVAGGDSTVLIIDSDLRSEGVGIGSGSAASGIYARQQSIVTIEGGSVTTTGNRAYGIRTADEGVIFATDLDIVTEGEFGYGVQVFGVGDGAGTSISLVGGSVTTNSAGYAPGIQVSGANGTLNVSGGTEIQTFGLGSAGISADRGGSAFLEDVSIVTAGDHAGGLRAYRMIGDDDTTITGERVSIWTAGDYASGAAIDTESSSGPLGGATIELTDSHIRTEGLWSHGLHVIGAGDGNDNRITFSGGSITTANTKGQFTQDGDGSRAYAMWARGSGASILATDTEIRTFGQRAYGAYATDGATINVSNSTIETDGFMAYGIYASGAGSQLTAENLDITTHGQVGDAAWAYNGGRLDIVGGTYIIHGGSNPLAGESSNGLIAVGGTNGVGNGIIDARDLTITMYGLGTTGVRAGAPVGSSFTSGTISLANSTVTVKGAESQAVEASFGSVVNISDSVLTSELGRGISLNDSANLRLDGVTLVSADESIRSSFTQSGQSQEIRVGAGSEIVTNNGTLLLVERSADGADAQVDFVLEAGSTTRGDIIDLDERSAIGFTDVTVEEGASWSGILRGVRNFFAAGDVEAEFEDDVVFDGVFEAEEGSRFTFAGDAEFNDGITSTGADFTFAESAIVEITGGIESNASTFSLTSTNAYIVGDIASSGSVFAFNDQGGETVIDGDLRLNDGSRTSGGTVGSAIAVTGSVVVDDTSIMGGNWAINGNLTNSGTLSLGNSVGVATVGGDMTFQGDSIFAVEIAGGGNTPGVHNDFLDVTGSVIINGGTVTVSALDPHSSYTNGTVYTIISAGDGVSGTFDGEAISKSIFIDPTLLYDDNNVFVRIAVAHDALTGIADTPNRLQTAGALEGFAQTGDALTVYNAIISASSSEAEARHIIDVTSGQVHAAAQNVVDHTFSQFSRTLRQQGASGLQGHSASSAMMAPVADAPGSMAWIAPMGGRGSIDGDGNAAGLDWWGAGVAGGYETSLDVATGQAFGGFGFGYARSHASIDGLASTADADTFQLGIYGGWSDGPWAVSGSLAYGASHLTTNRHILFGSIDRMAETDYWSHNVGFNGEAAYEIALTDTTTISPLATLNVGWSGHRGYTEQGAGALNLTGNSLGRTNFDTGLGFALQHVVPTESGQLTLRGRMLWEHAFADTVVSQTQMLEGSTTGFTIGGPDRGRDHLRVGAGFDWNVSDTVILRADYEGLFSRYEQNHGASLGLKVSF